MALEICMEGYAKSIQERNNERMEILKAKEFENLQHPTMLYGANKLMDPKLYDAVVKGDVDNFINTLERVSTDRKLSLTTIFERTSPSGNSLLHEAARFGKKEIVELIAHHFPLLLTRRNIIGDTALHVATKAEKSNIVDVLIKLIPNPREDTPGGSASSNADGDANVINQLLRMKNKIGNTALNEAVINGYIDGVECLFSADNQVAHHLDMEGKSPLHLAVETDHKEILVLLLEAPVGDDELVGRSREESPVYAAVMGKKLDMLEEINKKRPMLLYTTDEKGKTALHYAASIGYLEGVQFLLSNFSQSTLERSKKGDLPIHMASKKGHIEIVKELLQKQWPDPMELLNNEGENILHVAAKNGRTGLVQDMLRKPQLEKFLNAKDNNGNTPLHLASTNLHPNVLVSLTWDKRVDLKLTNKDGMNALDLSYQRWVNRFDTPTITRFRLLFVLWILGSAGTPITKKGIKIWRSERTRGPPSTSNLKDSSNSLALVAILVATVTFAAGITVPGGFKSSDKVTGQGMAILVNRKMFDLFIICDTIALFCSIIATFTLLGVPFGEDDYNVAVSYYYFANIFCSIALLTMSLAFISAVYLVVSELPWLGIVVVIMGIIFLAILVGIYLVMNFPTGIRSPVSRFCWHYTIPWMIRLTEMGYYGTVIEDKQQKKSQPVKDDKQEELQEMKEDKQAEK